MRNSYRNNRLVIPVFIFLSVAWAVLLYARSTGIIGRTKLGSTQGCTCHSATPNTSVTVTISGPTELDINQKGTYSITIEGGPLAAAGTNIATDNGTLAPIDESLRLDTGELTHTSPKTPSNNMVTFEFEYTAPSTTGEATIAANGNSVNLSGDNTGDAWNFADNFGITINPASAITENQDNVPADFRLSQNFPNPFNPSTQIDYQISKISKVKLTVYNIVGEKIRNLVDAFQAAGNYKINFNGSNLDSGTYFYVLSVDGQSQSRRMTLIK